MTKEVLRILCFSFFIILMSGLHTNCLADKYSDQYLSIKSPTTPIEFLQNIKFAIEKGLLDDPHLFKDDEKLWQLFGGQQIFKPKPTDPSNLGFLLTSFPKEIDSTVAAGKPADQGIKLSLSVINYGEKNKRTLLHLNNAQNLELDRPAVESILGHSDTYQKPPRHPSPKLPGQVYINYLNVEHELTTPTSAKAVVVASYHPSSGKLADLIIDIDE